MRTHAHTYTQLNETIQDINTEFKKEMQLKKKAKLKSNSKCKIQEVKQKASPTNELSGREIFGLEDNVEEIDSSIKGNNELKKCPETNNPKYLEHYEKINL